MRYLLSIALVLLSLVSWADINSPFYDGVKREYYSVRMMSDVTTNVYDKMNPHGAVFHEEYYETEDGLGYHQTHYRFYTNFTWPSSNGNIVINRTNYPTLIGQDTVYIPPYVTSGYGYRSHTEANLYCGVLAPTVLEMIHIVGEYGAYINPSTSSIQGNSGDSLYGVEIRNIKQNDHIDPWWWQYGMTGYLKYVYLKDDTIRGTNGLVGSYNPTLTLPNWSGDSTNAFWNITIDGLYADSVIGGNSGETAAWFGSLEMNQFWFNLQFINCTFLNYSSAAGPASYTHIQNCYNYSSIPMFYNDYFGTMGWNINPSGHAAVNFLECVNFRAFRCFFYKNFGDCFRVEGTAQITSMPGFSDTSAIGTSISDSSRKYCFSEIYDVSTDTSLSSYIRSSPARVSNITVFMGGAGIGLTPPSAYKNGLFEYLGDKYVSFHNCTVIGCLDTTFNSTTGPFLYTYSGGGSSGTVFDTSHNLLAQTYAASGLANTTLFQPITGGLLSTGSAAPSYITQDYYGNAMHSYIGAVQTAISFSQTRYYFADSVQGGNDGNACTFASPCRTISMANSIISTLGGGDTVSFENGGTFPGQLVIGISGTSGNHFLLMPYGTGADPIIGGMNLLSGWTNVGGNVWQTTYTGPRPNFLVYNNAIAPISTTLDSAAGFFWTQTPASASVTTVYDPTHAPTAWAGVGIGVKSSPYTYDTAVATAVSSTTITVSPSLSYNNVGGTGWFLRGIKPFLPGRWRDTASWVQVYSVGTPTGWYNPAQDTVCYITGQYITITGLAFQGGNNALIYYVFQTTGGNVVTNDSLKYAWDGIVTRGGSGVTATLNDFEQMTDNAIYKLPDPTYFWTVTHNTAKNIGLYPGMGNNGAGGTYQFINGVAGDSACITSYNTVGSTGGPAISSSGSGMQVDSNFLSHYCLLKADQGAVYCWEGTTIVHAQQQQVMGNYIHDGGGPLTLAGTNVSSAENADGLYFDSHMHGVVAWYNTLSNNPGIGIFWHGPSNNIQYNTVIGSGNFEALGAEVAGLAITGTIFKHNILSALTAGDYILALTSVNTDIPSMMSALDSNYFNHPLTLNSFYNGTAMSLSTWQSTYSSYDQHSTFQQLPFTLLTPPTITARTIWVPGIYGTPTGTVYGSFALPAYQGQLGYLLSAGHRSKFYNTKSIQHP